MPSKKKATTIDPIAVALSELARAVNRLAATQEAFRPQLGGGGGIWVGPNTSTGGGGGAGSAAIVRNIGSGGGAAGAAAQIPA